MDESTKSKSAIIKEALEQCHDVVVVDTRWSHYMSSEKPCSGEFIMVAPKKSLKTAEELETFMARIIPEGLDPIEEKTVEGEGEQKGWIGRVCIFKEVIGRRNTDIKITCEDPPPGLLEAVNRKNEKEEDVDIVREIEVTLLLNLGLAQAVLEQGRF